jgi:hypothetical protein
MSDDECPSGNSVGSESDGEEEAMESIEEEETAEDGGEDGKGKENEDEEEGSKSLSRSLVERTGKVLKTRATCTAIGVSEEGNTVSAKDVKKNIREYMNLYLGKVASEKTLYKLNEFDGIDDMVSPLLDSRVARTGLCSMLDVSLTVLDLLVNCKVNLFGNSENETITGVTRSIHKLMGTHDGVLSVLVFDSLDLLFPFSFFL